ncbi:MAG TPA: FmdE family protein [Patescibacteria group bacterium]|nr:FmdE family protein [Patescibacteria group bacterium]
MSKNDGNSKDISVQVPDSQFLSLLLKETAARHTHLCPRQVLGVRMALHGLQVLNLIRDDYHPRFLNHDKRLLVIVETDGCGADGVAIATNCSVGHRTLRILDYGKLAATLVDTHTNQAIRVIPSLAARQLALQHLPESSDRWHAYVQAYQMIPDSELMDLQKVQLTHSIAEILSKANSRAICSYCGEEVMNEREVSGQNGVICRNCAGDSYYTLGQ